MHALDPLSNRLLDKLNLMTYTLSGSEKQYIVFWIIEIVLLSFIVYYLFQNQELGASNSIYYLQMGVAVFLLFVIIVFIDGLSTIIQDIMRNAYRRYINKRNRPS